MQNRFCKVSRIQTVFYILTLLLFRCFNLNKTLQNVFGRIKKHLVLYSLSTRCKKAIKTVLTKTGRLALQYINCTPYWIL